MMAWIAINSEPDIHVTTWVYTKEYSSTQKKKVRWEWHDHIIYVNQKHKAKEQCILLSKPK